MDNNNLPARNNMTDQVFGITPNLLQEINSMNTLRSSTHGMFATVPIICKGNSCAYLDVCTMQNKPKGQRCPMEIATILARYKQWCDHFEIDISNDRIDPKDLVDVTLIKDLVNIEIQMMRAESKIAITGDFMAETLKDIDKKCNPYYEMDISPETNFLMTLNDKKIKILNQLNATRKDKANDKSKFVASELSIKLFQKVKSMNTDNIIDITDVDFDEVTEEEELNGNAVEVGEEQ